MDPEEQELEMTTSIVVSCNHCYCQVGELVGTVAHMSCCKCDDTMAAHLIQLPMNPYWPLVYPHGSVNV